MTYGINQRPSEGLFSEADWGLLIVASPLLALSGSLITKICAPGLLGPMILVVVVYGVVQDSPCYEMRSYALF